MNGAPSLEIATLLHDVHWAFANQLEAREIIPILKKLISVTEAASPARIYAEQRLSALVVEEDPWLAALLARRVLAAQETHSSWAILGLAHILLGNYHSAERAYRSAVRLMPSCVSYRHNLGHLLDAALDRPRAALPHLRYAFQQLPRHEEIASSYAHALLRTGQAELAFSTLCGANGGIQSEAAATLNAWQQRIRLRRAQGG